ncbi:hypothetical protein PaMx41_ORF3 [Pseudomonas phage PaMx41]|uniref:Uncharacterized protein n=1 Tax=Pseudomonas phage PaMx41 TaxID=1815976 RepID=A0A1C8HSR3_BPPP4|nr:hypothetical protein KNT55_gp04 [Pseudomonas phage PaMx41]ANA48966.1 hypothetical protein PaMx41_ORF3 [Pseudomonas phage PaMx41]
MEIMNVLDIRKLAIQVRCERADASAWHKAYFDWINRSLLEEFNRGASQFKARLSSLISRFPKSIRFNGV